MGIGNFIVYWKTDDICSDIAKDVGTRFDTSYYELERQLLKEKRVIELMKDELGEKMSIEAKHVYLFNRRQWWK